MKTRQGSSSILYENHMLFAFITRVLFTIRFHAFTIRFHAFYHP